MTRSAFDLFSLDGRVAMVTGAGRGIGRAFAHALGDVGAHVVVFTLNEDRAAIVLEELSDKGIEAIAVSGDVTRQEDVERCLEETLRRFGRLDIAVNNAGINRTSSAENTSAEEWDEVIEVNLRSVFLGCQAQARLMFASGYGKIINVGSIAATVVPHPQRQAAYNASKAAVVQLTRSLASEWAERGVCVNSISPGIVRTDLIERSPSLRPLMDKWIESIPMRRLASVEDLIGGVIFLASSASDYVTGHNLIIDGGYTVW